MCVSVHLSVGPGEETPPEPHRSAPTPAPSVSCGGAAKRGTAAAPGGGVQVETGGDDEERRRRRGGMEMHVTFNG